MHSVTRIMMRGGGKLKYKCLCQAFLSPSSRSAKKKQEKEKKRLILRLAAPEPI